MKLLLNKHTWESHYPFATVYMVRIFVYSITNKQADESKKAHIKITNIITVFFINFDKALIIKRQPQGPSTCMFHTTQAKQ